MTGLRRSWFRSVSPRRTEQEAGFTLVEALVAFVIVALVLTTALRVLAEGASWARRGPEQAMRIEEAASIMNGLIADLRLQPGEMEGSFADGGRWRARVTDVTAAVVPHAKARLLRVELFANAGVPARKPLFVTLATGSAL